MNFNKISDKEGTSYLEDILKAVKNGELSIEEASLNLKMQPFKDIDIAKIDLHRKLRQGNAEVIYGEGKSLEQIIQIVSAMLEEKEELILITRISENVSKELSNRFQGEEYFYSKEARLGVFGKFKGFSGLGKIAVISAGTSDIPVAKEAVYTLKALGNEVLEIYDVGVAGLHRLLARLDDIMSAKVVIVIAGMEGALASVVGGLSTAPVIAVPTSIGYGTSFGGVTALLSMLNSCASGMSVMNIDNGFGAAMLAHKINHIGDK